MARKCGPDAVVGEMLATAQRAGGKVDEATLAGLSNEGKAAYAAKNDELSANTELWRKNQAGMGVVAHAKGWGGAVYQSTKALMADYTDAPSLFGWDTIRPFQEASEAHFAQWKTELASDPAAGRSEYIAAMHRVVKDVEVTMPQGLRQLLTSSVWGGADGRGVAYWNQYKDFMTGGGRMYPKGPEGRQPLGGVAKKVLQAGGNVLKNTVTLNPNILLGNIAEIHKIHALYPKEFYQATGVVLKDTVGSLITDPFKLFKPDPRLDGAGFEGVDRPVAQRPLEGNALKQLIARVQNGHDVGYAGLQKLTTITSQPLNKIAYEAGRIKAKREGGVSEHEMGLIAARRTAFQGGWASPTFIEIQHHNGAYALQNFGIKATRAHMGMMSDALGLNGKENIANGMSSLVLWHLGMGAAGMVGAALEKKDPIQGFLVGASSLPFVGSLYKLVDNEGYQANRSLLSGMVEFNQMGALYLTSEILNSQVARVGREWNKGVTAYQAGDMTQGNLHFAEALWREAPLLNSVLGAKFVQKTGGYVLDVMQGEKEGDGQTFLEQTGLAPRP